MKESKWDENVSTPSITPYQSEVHEVAYGSYYSLYASDFHNSVIQYEMHCKDYWANISLPFTTLVRVYKF